MQHKTILNKVAMLALLLCTNVAALETHAKVVSGVEQESGQKKINGGVANAPHADFAGGYLPRP